MGNNKQALKQNQTLSIAIFLLPFILPHYSALGASFNGITDDYSFPSSSFSFSNFSLNSNDLIFSELPAGELGLFSNPDFKNSSEAGTSVSGIQILNYAISSLGKLDLTRRNSPGQNIEVPILPQVGISQIYEDIYGVSGRRDKKIEVNEIYFSDNSTESQKSPQESPGNDVSNIGVLFPQRISTVSVIGVPQTINTITPGNRIALPQTINTQKNAVLPTVTGAINVSLPLVPRNNYSTNLEPNNNISGFLQVANSLSRENSELNLRSQPQELEYASLKLRGNSSSDIVFLREMTAQAIAVSSQQQQYQTQFKQKVEQQQEQELRQQKQLQKQTQQRIEQEQKRQKQIEENLEQKRKQEMKRQVEQQRREQDRLQKERERQAEQQRREQDRLQEQMRQQIARQN
jgi:hypothetical protein